MDSESRTGKLGQLFHLKKSSTYTYKMLVSSYNTLNVFKAFTGSHCKQCVRKTWSPTYKLIFILNVTGNISAYVVVKVATYL